MITVIEKLEFWDESFLAVVLLGIEGTLTTFMSTCVDTTKSQIDLDWNGQLGWTPALGTLFVREDTRPDVHVTSNVELSNNVRLLLNVELLRNITSDC